jgi:hypothetical protein
MFVNGIEKALIFNLKDETVDENAPDANSFGLYDVACEDGTESIAAKKSVKAIETMIDVLDGLVPLEAKRRDVGKGTLFEIVFEDPEDRSKKVTVFWYTEMDGTGIKDSVDCSDEDTSTVLHVDSEDVRLVDMEGKLSTPDVYDTSVMVRIEEKLQYLVESIMPITEPFTFTNTIGMEFVLIPAGEFEMGAPSDEEGRYSDEGPVHHVNIENPFYMGRYEVTQKQWRAIMGDNPSWFTHGTMCMTSSGSSTRKKAQTSTVCHLRQNGNMPVGLAPPQDIHLGMTSQNLAIMLGMAIIQAVRRIRSVRRNPISGDCMTCTAMSGNGCRIAGIAITTAHLRMVVHGKVEMVPAGSSVAVAGTTAPDTAGLLVAARTTPATATPTSAFAF